ncbi:MAG: alkaline phosphatase family protein [Cytophagales bacterium]|nr:alkaline phosphatase family protein [Cytophagales bacterium]
MKASLLFLLLFAAGTPFFGGCKRSPQSAATPADTTKAAPLTTIAFGSCNRENKEQPLWPVIVGNRPQLWIWLGDNIYGDTQNMDTLQAKYYRQRSNPGYQLLAVSTPIIGIWDDHDYGVNDGGKEYPQKKQSQQLMLDFLGEPKNSPRRKQAGAYASYTYGPAGKRVKVILLDARYFRDPLKKEGKANVPDPAGKILGEVQWQWLEKELRGSPADVHLIGSGIQILPDEHPYEKWANFPRERQRLFNLLAATGARGVVLLSGDRHIAEIMKHQPDGVRYPVYEITASGLTHSSTQNTGEPNRYRVGKLVNVLNFGLIRIDWENRRLQLQVRGLGNELLESQAVGF